MLFVILYHYIILLLCMQFHHKLLSVILGAQRKIHVMEVDLRWGVTEEEAQSGKVCHFFSHLNMFFFFFSVSRTLCRELF